MPRNEHDPRDGTPKQSQDSPVIDPGQEERPSTIDLFAEDTVVGLVSVYAEVEQLPRRLVGTAAVDPPHHILLGKDLKVVCNGGT